MPESTQLKKCNIGPKCPKYNAYEHHQHYSEEYERLKRLYLPRAPPSRVAESNTKPILPSLGPIETFKGFPTHLQGAPQRQAETLKPPNRSHLSPRGTPGRSEPPPPPPRDRARDRGEQARRDQERHEQQRRDQERRDQERRELERNQQLQQELALGPQFSYRHDTPPEIGCIRSFRTLPRQDVAHKILTRAAWLIRPILRQRRMHINIFMELDPRTDPQKRTLGYTEFYPGTKHLTTDVLAVRIREHNDWDKSLPIARIMEVVLHELSHVQGNKCHDNQFYETLFSIQRQFYRMLSPVCREVDGPDGFLFNYTHHKKEYGPQMSKTDFYNMCAEQRQHDIHEQLDREEREVSAKYWNKRYKHRYLGHFGYRGRRPPIAANLLESVTDWSTYGSEYFPSDDTLRTTDSTWLSGDATFDSEAPDTMSTMSLYEETICGSGDWSYSDEEEDEVDEYIRRLSL